MILRLAIRYFLWHPIISSVSTIHEETYPLSLPGTLVPGRGGTWCLQVTETVLNGSRVGISLPRVLSGMLLFFELPWVVAHAHKARCKECLCSFPYSPQPEVLRRITHFGLRENKTTVHSSRNNLELDEGMMFIKTKVFVVSFDISYFLFNPLHFPCHRCVHGTSEPCPGHPFHSVCLRNTGIFLSPGLFFHLGGISAG